MINNKHLLLTPARPVGIIGYGAYVSRYHIMAAKVTSNQIIV